MKTSRPLRRRGPLALLLALALSLALLPAASQAARVPTYDVGDRITFKVTSNAEKARQYGIYLTVANKRRLDGNGELKRTDIGTFARMNRRGRNLWKYTTPNYTFDTWFMQVPGTYYWQTQYTDCSFRGCSALSRVRVFKVVG